MNIREQRLEAEEQLRVAAAAHRTHYLAHHCRETSGCGTWLALAREVMRLQRAAGMGRFLELDEEEGETWTSFW